MALLEIFGLAGLEAVWLECGVENQESTIP